MSTILLFLTLLTSCAFAATKLVLVGGGNRPQAAMEEFVKAAGGENSNLLIIPWASESLEGAQNIKNELSKSRPAKIAIIADNIELKTKLKLATGIFFTGGDQNRLMKEMETTETIELFKELFQKGIVFGGTSAGTAIMSDPMLSGTADLTVIDGSKVELVKGLGLLPKNIIVDQHFVLRQRFNRLAGVILKKKNTFGIGIDENTSLIITNREAQVIGPTQVLLFSKLESNELSVKIFTNGEKFRLP